ncbi:hypothetical protein D3C73_1170740 [compost metagenome]
MRRPGFIATLIKCSRIENHSLQPFVMAALDRRLPKHRLQHRQCGSSVSESQIYLGQAKGKPVLLREDSGCLQIPLTKHYRYLHSRNMGNLCPVLTLAGEIVRLLQNRGRFAHRSPNKLQLCEQYFACNLPVTVLKLPGKQNTLLTMHHSRVPFVPFIIDPR